MGPPHDAGDDRLRGIEILLFPCLRRERGNGWVTLTKKSPGVCAGAFVFQRALNPYSIVGMMKAWSDTSPVGQRWVTVLILV